MQQLIQNARQGVYRISFHSSEGDLIGAGSSFWANGHLITNNHVAIKDGYRTVTIERESERSAYDRIELTRQDFRSRLKAGSTEDNHDYAILDLPEIAKHDPYSFELDSGEPPEICRRCIVFGFAFGQRSFCMHTGLVSSVFSSSCATIVQVDAAVNHANSGGPLVDAETGRVLAIVSRKAAGLTSAFEELEKAVRKNIELLENPGATFSVAGVDPIKAIRTTQLQMLTTIREVKRSANVGIGYGIFVDALREEAILSEPA